MNTVATLNEYLHARRAEIDASLEAALRAHIDSPQVLVEAMRYSLIAGGKRLRPTVCLAAAEAVDEERAAAARSLAMPAACAVEMIHTYSLIHDDLPAMDNDTMRRGRPTLHVMAGEGIAILAGDGLLTEAFGLLAREPATADPLLIARKLRVIAVIAEGAGVRGMVGGQALDLSTVVDRTSGRTVDGRQAGRTATTSADADALRLMHAKKTGALIKASALAGAIIGGGNDATVAAIGVCAEQYGLAFQIVDDILDVEGASTHLGKTAGKDAAAGKVTYPALHGLAAARRMASECIERAERSLRDVGLERSRLSEFGRWIVDRTN